MLVSTMSHKHNKRLIKFATSIRPPSSPLGIVTTADCRGVVICACVSANTGEHLREYYLFLSLGLFPSLLNYPFYSFWHT